MVENLHNEIKAPIADYADATIYFTLIIIKRGGIDIGKLRGKLDCQESLSVPFESIYDMSYRFFYNSIFADKLKTTYLGYICGREETLGLMRLDYFLVENNIIDMVGSLHIHFIVKSRFDFTKEDDNIKKLSTILRDIYNLVEDPSSDKNSSETEFLGRFKGKLKGLNIKSKREQCNLVEYLSSDKNSPETEFLNRFKDTLKELNIKSKREHALPMSRYMYISVCNLKSLKLEHLEELEQEHCWENIYKLLYFHAEGVDAKIAKEKLKKDMWTSADFYLNFYQPGALLSLSTPYPSDIYKKNIRYFLPTLNDSGEIYSSEYLKDIRYFLPTLNDRGEIACGDPSKGRRKGKRYETYDLLPEYPALRYMGMASLEFSGVIEELLRGLYDDLMELQRKQYLIRLVMALYKLPGIETVYIACKHLEYIRLPILREFISRLIRNKHQEAIDESINYLNSYLFNRMILILTILAIILTVIKLDVVGVALERLKEIISSVKL